MPLIAALIAIVASIVVLLVLIVRMRIHPFIAMSVVAIVLGLIFQVPLVDVPGSDPLQPGIFTVLLTALNRSTAHILILVGLGCIIGEIIARSGGSEVLGQKLLRLTGPRRGVLAMALAGLLVGSTIFFDTAVILLAPVAIAVARQAGRHVAVMAVPMAVAVLAVHAIIPPHPGAVAVAVALGTDYGLLIALGMLCMLPGAALGCWWAYRRATRLEQRGVLVAEATAGDSDAPSGGSVSGAASGRPATNLTVPVRTATATQTDVVAGILPKLLTVLLLPVVLILVATLVSQFLPSVHNVVTDALRFIGVPEIALIITTIVAYFTLLSRTQRSVTGMTEVGRVGLRPVGEIVLSTGGGIAFGGIIAATGIGQSLVNALSAANMPIVIFGFLLALVLRATLGTTTAAVTTVATLLAGSIDLAAYGPLHVALLTVAICAGGVCLSHVNDAGFWVLSRYFTISELVMLQTWTVAVTIMGVVCGVLATTLWALIPLTS